MNFGTIYKELKIYMDSFLNPANPIYLSIFIGLLIVFLFSVFIKYGILPLTVIFNEEKSKLLQENREIIQLFAELDPDPIIRINVKGTITYRNKAAISLFKERCPLGNNICDYLPNIKMNQLPDIIRKNKSISFYSILDGKYYSILVQGISKYELLQIYYHDITELKNYENKLRELSNSLQDLLENERQRISYELHDSIGQNLSIAKLIVNKIFKVLPEKPQRGHLFRINELLETSLKELKRISYNLKPRILEEMGLEPALISLCESVSKESGIKGSIDITSFEKRLDQKLEIALFRITQEALTNIVKHSNAKKFKIRIANIGSIVRLMIIDDGNGFNWEEQLKSSDKNCMGLFSIQERINTNNGVLRIDSNPHQGTVIKLELPIMEAQHVH